MNVTIHRTWNMDIYVLTLNYDRLFGPLPAVFDHVPSPRRDASRARAFLCLCVCLSVGGRPLLPIV